MKDLSKEERDRQRCKEWFLSHEDIVVDVVVGGGGALTTTILVIKMLLLLLLLLLLYSYLPFLKDGRSFFFDKVVS